MLCPNQTQTLIPPQCSAQSVGAATQLLSSLIQTLLTVQCSVSPNSMWPPNYGRVAEEHGLDEYDFIVIGAGTAGSIVASRLSENPNWKVLLLEAGGNPPIESEIPGMFGSLKKTSVDWQFYAQSSKACHARKDGCYWPRGKMLGGTGSINANIYMRGNAQNYDYWSSLGNDGWDYESVLPYFKKSEANQHAPFVSYDNGRYHSNSGPMKIDFLGDLRETDQMFINAAAEAGIPYVDNLNADKNIGYSNYQGNVADGRRQSSAKAFLASAKDRQNLHVIKRALAKKILIKHKRAHGVKFTYKGKVMRAHAREEVILSAGTVMSPVILMRSGIGPNDELAKHNITPKSNLNGVGKNLYDHVILRLFFTFNPTETTTMSPFDSLYNFAVNNIGPYVNSRFVGAFVSSKNDPKYADVQFYPVYFTSNSSAFRSHLQYENFKSEIVDELIEINKNHNVAIIGVEIMQPKSRGSIELNGTSINKPIIRPEYYANREDMDTMMSEAKRQISFTNTKAYKANGGEFLWLPLKACENYELKSDAYLECYIQQFSFPGYHPVGTSKMGPSSDSEAVVDPQLRVNGVQGLRVIDASVMPYPVSANTNAPTCMIAEKGSDLIKSSYS